MSNKQDLNGVRSAQDIERKYNFSALLGLKKNIEIQAKALVKIQNELNTFINVTIGDIVDELQEQIDGKVTTWYYEGTPTLNNLPAVQWTTDDEKSEHIGDLYYDKSTGYAYRFQLENNIYIWQKITDQDVTTSLATASAAKDTADSKRHIFIQQPTIPYDTGDLWISNNEIFICQVSRHSGSFNSNDWVNNLKYTDDTYAIAVEGELNTFVTTTLQGIVDNLQEQIDGKITTWYYQGIPTLSNNPAVNWTTNDKKNEHIGDLYYDKSTGYAYRFQLENSTYSWQKIADQDIQTSLSIASSAQDTADSKRQVFIQQPTIPYDEGDLWVNNNEIYICINSKSSGSFNSNDWVNNLKYTDDTYAIAVEGDLYTFINTTMPGIVDGLQEQIDGKITTWYYQGIPTLSNNPAVNWTTNDKKNEHIGDLYYDKSTGYAYRFQLENNIFSWLKIQDQDIGESLLAASAAQDTADSKRQVFIQQPTIPYDEGDLWVNNNEIYICINSRETGSFNSSDWTNNLKYTDDSYSSAIVDELTGTTTQILSGQIIREMANYTKFTDLATGGSTTIAGENITTGKIKSQNYVQNVSGMQIDLANGKIDTKNTKWDEYGNILLNNGAKVISDEGLMTNLQFIGKSTNNLDIFGLSVDLQNSQFYSDKIVIDVDIPNNFTVKRAYITLVEQPVMWDNVPVWGYPRAIGIFKENSNPTIQMDYEGDLNSISIPKTQLTSIFENDNTWTPDAASLSSHDTQIKTTNDLSLSYFNAGSSSKFVIESTSIPNFDFNSYFRDGAERSGILCAYLNVIGFIKES